MATVAQEPASSSSILFFQCRDICLGCNGFHLQIQKIITFVLNECTQEEKTIKPSRQPLPVPSLGFKTKFLQTKDHIFKRGL